MDMEKFYEIIQSQKPVFVEFYAEWCGPCRAMKPTLLDVAERLGEHARIVQIDIDKEKLLAEQFCIHSVPTLIIFKQGKQLWRQSGSLSSQALTKLLTDYAKK
jgi:thioredoxin 1